jgi:hypothetical protein
MLLIPLLQPVAPAHVRERDRKKANRHYHKYNVLHTPNLRENAAADVLRV